MAGQLSLPPPDVVSQGDLAAYLDPHHWMMKDLVGWWPMQEGAGLATQDFSPYGHHGTLTNMDQTTDWVSGRFGGSALDFDGTNDYVTIPSVSAFDIAGDDFSLSVWFRRPATNKQSIIRKDNGSGTGRNWGLFFLGSGAIRIGYFRSSGTQIYLDSNTSAYSADVWNHLVAQRVGDSFEIYLNGALIKSGTTSGTHGTADYSGGVAVDIGRRSAAGNEEYYDGLFQDVRFWNGRALTASEVSGLYVAPWAPIRRDLVYPATAAAPPSGFKPAWLATQHRVMGGGII